MFEFSTEYPAKIPLKNIATVIEPIKSYKYPWVMTKGFNPLSDPLILAIFGYNKYGYKMISFYPLNQSPVFLPPKYEIVGINDPILKQKDILVCYTHEQWKIIQTFSCSLTRITEAIKRKNLDFLPRSLTDFIEHCYMTGIIGDESVEKAERLFSRLEKVMTRADGNESEGEKRMALKIASNICEQIFNSIKSEIKI